MCINKLHFFTGKSRKFDVNKKKLFLCIRWLVKARFEENEPERNKSADIIA